MLEQQEDGFQQPIQEHSEDRDLPYSADETLPIIEIPEEPHNAHYSEQRGHFERGVMHRAMVIANSRGDIEADVVSRGQLYLDRRLHVARFPRDGRR